MVAVLLSQSIVRTSSFSTQSIMANYSCTLSAAFRYSPECEGAISRHVVATTVITVLLSIAIVILVVLQVVMLLVFFRMNGKKKITFFRHSNTKVKKLAPIVNELKHGKRKQSSEGGLHGGHGSTRDEVQLLDDTDDTGLKEEDHSFEVSSHGKVTEQNQMKKDISERKPGGEDSKETKNAEGETKKEDKVIANIEKNTSAISRLYSLLKERESFSSGSTDVEPPPQNFDDLSYTFAAALSELAGTESLQREKFVELSDPYFVPSDLSGGFNENLFRLGSSGSKSSNA